MSLAISARLPARSPSNLIAELGSEKEAMLGGTWRTKGEKKAAASEAQFESVDGGLVACARRAKETKARLDVMASAAANKLTDCGGEEGSACSCVSSDERGELMLVPNLRSGCFSHSLS